MSDLQFAHGPPLQTQVQRDHDALSETALDNAWASEDTVVQVHGQGPFAITYVNPADDPSK